MSFKFPMAFGFGASIVPRDAIDDGVANPRGDNLAKLSIVFVSLAGFFVTLRILTRHFYIKQLGIDDALIVAAMVLSVGMTVTYNEEAKNGFGLHSDQVGRDHKIAAFKAFFAAQILYKVTVCLTKLSLGAMYLRIFPNRRFQISVIAVMVISTIYSLVAVLLTVFACRPIRKSWVKTLPGECLDSKKIWASTSVLNILTDALIILLPIQEIRALQLPLGKKIMLSALFSLGSFVIACTIVRMITVSPKTTASDQTYYQATSNSWTFVETDIGIICACLPVLRIPISKQLRRMFFLSRQDRSTEASVDRFQYSQGSRNKANVVSPSSGDGDSVEELINEMGGIRMTKTFGTRIHTEESKLEHQN